MLTPEQIDEYILLFHRGELSPARQAELAEWLRAMPAHREYFRETVKLYTYIEAAGNKELIDEMQNSVETRLNDRIRGRRLRRIVRSIAGVAAVAVIAIGSVLLWNSTESEVAAPAQKFGEIGSAKAILILANGEKISLNEQKRRRITTPEGNLIRQDSIGHLYIHAADSNRQHRTARLDNAVWVPQGGEYHLTLSDGTEVWLNAETRLKFPTRFTGGKRIVELNGEAYFEVAHNASKPFIIHTGGVDVKVLGTTFGIRSYEEEDAILTTLVSGKVCVQSTQGEVLLAPSYQARYDKLTENLTVEEVDIELYIGWKDGKLLYDNCPLEEILRDLERWYSFDVFYANSRARKIPFTLNIRKHEKITEVLELMQRTERVHFDIKGNTITAR